MRATRAVVIAIVVVSLWVGAAAQDLPRLPFKLDTEYRYLFSSGAVNIGSQSFKVSAAEREGKPVYVLKEKLNLKEKDISQQASSRLILDKDLHPVEYAATVETRAPALPLHSGKFEMTYKFTPGKVLVEMVRDGKPYHRFDVYVEPNIYCIANNRISQFALLVSKIFPDAKDKVKLRVFHLDSARVLDFELEKGELQQLTIGSKTYKAHRCRFWLDGQPMGLFFVTPEGLLVQDIEKGGALVIRLTVAKEQQAKKPSE